MHAENLTKLEEEQRKEAIAYVGRLKDFYKHLISYITVNIVLVIINLITSPHKLWFFWVLLFWGIGIFLQGVRVFLPVHRIFSKTWEERKIREYLDNINENNR
jgi:hypothetical protein